jgi:hypothetical protein
LSIFPPFVRLVDGAGIQPVGSGRAAGSKFQTEGEAQMKFLCMYKPSKQEGIPPSQEDMAKMGKMIEEWTKSGVLLGTEGCLPSALGARVRLAAGSFKVTDGPFTESKEIIGGYALIQANSKEEAIEYNKQFLKIAGDGETEIRQLYDGTSCPAKAAATQSA